jgi:hypothetical protein
MVEHEEMGSPREWLVYSLHDKSSESPIAALSSQPPRGVRTWSSLRSAWVQLEMVPGTGKMRR